jgi:hypothetical protein
MGTVKRSREFRERTRIKNQSCDPALIRYTEASWRSEARRGVKIR